MIGRLIDWLGSGTEVQQHHRVEWVLGLFVSIVLLSCVGLLSMDGAS